MFNDVAGKNSIQLVVATRQEIDRVLLLDGEALRAGRLRSLLGQVDSQSICTASPQQLQERAPTASEVSDEVSALEVAGEGCLDVPCVGFEATEGKRILLLQASHPWSPSTPGALSQRDANLSADAMQGSRNDALGRLDQPLVGEQPKHHLVLNDHRLIDEFEGLWRPLWEAKESHDTLECNCGV